MILISRIQVIICIILWGLHHYGTAISISKMVGEPILIDSARCNNLPIPVV